MRRYTHWGIEVTTNTEVAEKFFGLAKAYLMAAEALAGRVVDADHIPDVMASACMFNARLSVELFLKGMIVQRDPAGKFATHKLEDLGVEFFRLYSGPEFRWKIPFTAQVVGGTESERRDAVKENLKMRPLDQVFRYPLDTKGTPWEMVSGVRDDWFRAFVDDIRSTMDRFELLAKNGA